MFSNALAWIGDAVVSVPVWFAQIGLGVGFDLIGYLVASTCVSIAIAYLLAPAVGSSTKANSRHNRPNKKEQ